MSSPFGGKLLSVALMAAAVGAVPGAHGAPVTFTVQNVGPLSARLVIALFRPTSKDWEKRFKRSENSDMACTAEVSGKRTTETFTCDLAPSEYIGIAFVDTDGNGQLTHGALGPTEQFGLTGIEEAIRLPPDFKRTIIDTKLVNHFLIVLN
jgi:uncharacterized protein (DUF2141 family)